MLKEIIVDSAVLTQTLYIEEDGPALKRLTEERSMEGVVGKRKNSRYAFSRSTDWVKVKNWQYIDTVILGFRRQPFALIVGLYGMNGQPRPVATVEFGLSPTEKKAFLSVVPQIHRAHRSGIQWIEPSLCGRIRYLEKTERGHLRIVTFDRFLPGKKPLECYFSSYSV